MFYNASHHILGLLSPGDLFYFRPPFFSCYNIGIYYLLSIIIHNWLCIGMPCLLLPEWCLAHDRTDLFLISELALHGTPSVEIEEEVSLSLILGKSISVESRDRPRMATQLNTLYSAICDLCHVHGDVSVAELCGARRFCKRRTQEFVVRGRWICKQSVGRCLLSQATLAKCCGC